jgi:glycosyltransferase involved in cell wall biosynthesis
VSIGLAVYNGADYLEAAIESILAQTFADFELIISDNASTDDTEAICRSFAQRDHRIRYHRNAGNIGGVNNENQTVHMATAPYFRWAAHDDLLAPTLLERLVNALDISADAVLAYSASIDIDGQGNEIRRTNLKRGLADRPSQRFHELAFRDHSCEATYGLVRRDIMLETGLQGNYMESDRVMLCDLALRGPFVVVDDHLFMKRYHDKNRYDTDWMARSAWFSPNDTGRLTLPNWRALVGFTKTVVRSRIGWREKLRCTSTLVRWVHAYHRALIRELVQVARVMMIPRERRFAGERIWE